MDDLERETIADLKGFSWRLIYHGAISGEMGRGSDNPN